MAGAPTVIDTLFNGNNEVLQYLGRQGEVSHQAHLTPNLAKTLVISAASYFEYRLLGAIAAFVARTSANNPVVVSLVKQKAIDRQYHTYFEWSGNNANKFFSLLGQGFRMRAETRIRNSIPLRNSIRDFLELGRMRNELAHLNFASFAIEKTSDEVYGLYQGALTFVEMVEDELARL